MDYVGVALDAIPISENSTSAMILIDSGAPHNATKGTVALYKGVHFIYDGSKWNSIKTDTTEIKAYIDNVIGVIENGAY